MDQRDQIIFTARIAAQAGVIGTIEDIPCDMVEIGGQTGLLFAYAGIAPQERYQHMDLMRARHDAYQMDDDIGKPPRGHNGKVK